MEWGLEREILAPLAPQPPPILALVMKKRRRKPGQCLPEHGERGLRYGLVGWLGASLCLQGFPTTSSSYRRRRRRRRRRTTTWLSVLPDPFTIATTPANSNRSGGATSGSNCPSSPRGAMPPAVCICCLIYHLGVKKNWQWGPRNRT